MSVNAAPARPGCGCGGSGGCGGGGGGCGCGGGCGSGTVPANLTATAFVRPRFFAGQLLTEDDLSALTAYTTAKDRLHNRYLFGAGVVCGLWVSCDPCGGGTVTVQPGYALDCCGNDLVLPCAATLDVNAMIRDLRAAQLGQDCGDPCAGQGTATSGYQSSDARPALLPVRAVRRAGHRPRRPLRDRGAMRAGGLRTDPDPGGDQLCPQVPRGRAPPDDLWSRINACLPSSDILVREARLKAYSAPMTAAAARNTRPPSARKTPRSSRTSGQG